jgi:hypothetical protein
MNSIVNPLQAVKFINRKAPSAVRSRLRREPERYFSKKAQAAPIEAQSPQITTARKRAN